VWLDGLIGVLAVGAVVVGLLVAPIAAAAQGSPAAVVTNIAYPVVDLLLLVFVVAVCAFTGWRPGRGWILLGLAFVLLALADTVYLYRLATGTYEGRTLLDSGWLFAFALLGVAAWQSPTSFAMVGALDGTRILIVPVAFVGLALGVLVAAAPLDVPPLATGLAAAAIVASAARVWMSFREIHALAAARREAVTDELTGLPNRRRLYRRLHEAIEAADAQQRSAALLLIDLDHFKELNDTLGHHAGDLLLRQVGPRLQGVVRDGDIARLGGDEFAVVLDDTAAAERIAARLGDALRQPFDILDVHLRIDASIGIAHYPAHGTTPEALMQRADIAMYQAKTGRRGHQTYVEAADHLTRERLELMSALPEAIEGGEIVLHYQPLVDVRTNEVVTAEALVRWQHPERGLLMPGAFLAYAEQGAVMHRLTLRVLDLALAQCASWREEGIQLDVAVNVSATNLLDAGFAEQVRDALARYDLAPSSLQLEITEDVVMTDPEKAARVLDELSALGVEIAIDDYGKGYSSLAYLKRLPVDELKIDRSFITHLATDSTDRAIVRSTVEPARSLGIHVVAEGVEDDVTLRILSDLGADIAQGYHFTAPLPPDEFAAWLRGAGRRREDAAVAGSA
jgi:diguanylate cyclase (GGDEF)-like protein